MVRRSSERRRRRECRALAATHGPPANKECRRQVPQVQPNHPAFPARWAFRLLRALLGDRLVCPHHPRDAARHLRELDTSIGASGPHDLAACNLPFVHALARAAPECSHRLPTSRLVTTANRPSSSRRDGRKHRPDLPDGASLEAAANWLDGQSAHEGHAWTARRANELIARDSSNPPQEMRCYDIGDSSRTCSGCQNAARLKAHLRAFTQVP